MDNLTHTLVGVAVAHSGFRRRYGPGVTLALAIASNLPDLDVLWGLVHDGPNFAYRRMLTHAVIGVPILAALGAAVHRRFFPQIEYRVWFFLYLLGAGLHVIFDLVNSFGVVLLYPFSRHRFELAWIFIIDLALWFFLLVPLVLSRWRSKWTSLEDLSKVAIRCVLIYIAACALLHQRSEQILRRLANEQNMTTTFMYVFPEALGPQRFRGVVREGSTWRVFKIDSVRGRAELVKSLETHDQDPDVKRILQTSEGRLLSWFAKAPVWERVGQDGTAESVWKVYDLRFESTVIKRENPFAFGFEMSGDHIRYLGRR